MGPCPIRLNSQSPITDPLSTFQGCFAAVHRITHDRQTARQGEQPGLPLPPGQSPALLPADGPLCLLETPACVFVHAAPLTSLDTISIPTRAATLLHEHNLISIDSFEPIQPKPSSVQQSVFWARQPHLPTATSQQARPKHATSYSCDKVLQYLPTTFILCCAVFHFLSFPPDRLLWSLFSPTSFYPANKSAFQST